VTDITYLKVAVGWVYLATVIDLLSRKVVGWSISDSLATELVSEVLRDAIEKRQPKRGELLHHSDRGCQYTSDSYQRTLQTLGIECSMSRKGNCYDNAVAERFFWSLKHEWTHHEEHADLDEARGSVPARRDRNLLQFSATPPDARLPLTQRLRSRKRSGISSVILGFQLCPKVLGYRHLRSRYTNGHPEKFHFRLRQDNQMKRLPSRQAG